MNGDGFFILRKPNGNGSPLYTRNGDFSLNSNGLLYDGSNGMAVQGYMADKNGNITQTGTPGDVTIPLGLQSQAVGTGLNSKLKFGNNGDQVFDVSLGGNSTRRSGSKRRRACRPARRGHRRAVHDLDDDLRLARQRAPRADHVHARRDRRSRRPAGGQRSAERRSRMRTACCTTGDALEGHRLVRRRHDVRRDPDAGFDRRRRRR